MTTEAPIDLTGLDDQALAFLSSEEQWNAKARANQILPIDGWTMAIARSGRGWGKMVSILTQLPTPSGWIALGDVVVGDELLDEAGRVCKVTNIFEGTPKKAYRIHFSDGTFIDAGEEHLWVTWTHRDRKQYQRYSNATLFPDEWPAFKGDILNPSRTVVGSYGPEIRTTQEIVDTLKIGKRGDANHCIPVALPLQLPEIELSVDPWVLGYWLGNGAARTACVTSSSHRGNMDAEFVASRLSRAGYGFTRKNYDGYSNFSIRDLRSNLPLENKHIPAEYLRASIEQRTALLRGLMDSDGYAEDSKVEFCSTSEILTKQVLELVRSLGERPAVYEDRARLNGKDYGPRFRINWRPSLFNPFSLPRKADKIPAVGAQGLRLRHRMIVAAEEIPVSPMRCLTVDSPNHMFLCGEAMVPTHNTETGAQLTRRVAGMYPGIVIHAVAPTHSDLIGVMFSGISGLLAVTPPEMIESTNFSAAIPIIKFKNGSIVKGFSSQSPDRLRGPQGTFVWGDEIAAWENAEETLANIDFSTRIVYKTPDGRLIQPQKFYTTTPRPLRWLSELIARCQIVISGSTYDNKDNLASDFLRDLAMYEGTEIGRQEIYGELLKIGDAVIVKEKWLRLWPADQPLPWFDYIVVSLDTALTQRTYDPKTFKNDPTACTVWGVFTHESRWNVMLLNCWDDMLGMPSLIEAAKKEMRQVYGRRTEKFLTSLVGQQFHRDQEKRPDLLIIEDKGSGISLRQMLANEGQDSYPYNPGRADKLARIHSVSHVPASGRVWLIESEVAPGEYKSWMKRFVKEVCSYAGPKTTPHDDYVDTCLVGETVVRMGDGSGRRLEDVRVGDFVATPIGPRRVLHAGQTGVREVYELMMFSGRKLIGTGNHPVSRNGVFSRLDSLCPFDGLDVWPSSKTLSVVDAVRELRVPTTTRPVFNLRVEEAECYYANDILVHNCSQFWRYFADRWMTGGSTGSIRNAGEQGSVVNVNIEVPKGIEGEDRMPGEMPEVEWDNPYGD